MQQGWRQFADIRRVTGVELSLADGWPLWTALAAAALAALIAATVYRGQRRLGRGAGVSLVVLRGGALGLLGFLLLKPTLAVEAEADPRKVAAVLVDRSRSMATADQRSRPADLREAAAALGLVDPGASPAGLDRAIRNRVKGATRFQIVRALMDQRSTHWLEELAAKHPSRGYLVGETLTPLAEGREGLVALEGVAPDASSTGLGAAIEGVLSRHAEEPIAGIVLLTDGASNTGPALRDVARQAAGQGVPLFPVSIGVADPPDVAVERISARDVVFVGDRVRVRLRVRATGFAGAEATIRARFAGKVVAERRVELVEGDAAHALSFVAEAEQLGDRSLEVEVEPLDGEATAANNRRRQTVRVIDQRVRVLYIERQPRWEYRYLKRMLDGDPRIEARYWLLSADADLAAASERFVGGLGDDANAFGRYDLVTLGDVPVDVLSTGAMRSLAALVRQRGGAMVMLAGDGHAPGAYRGTPIEPLLPVRPSAGGGEAETPDAGVHPVLTRAGREDEMMVLHAAGAINAALWAGVRPLYRLPRLAGPRPGAGVLLTLSDADQRIDRYPLIARHRVGAGWAMYVGSDALWRMRRVGGPAPHRRFWRQAVRGLSMSRLIAGGQRITIETDRRSYREAERVGIRANVLDAAWQPVEAERFVVEVEGGEPSATAADGSDAGGAATVALRPVRGQAGVYAGDYVPQSPGHYTVRAPQAAARDANVASFDVYEINLESQQPGRQASELEELAALTGGSALRPSRIGRLPRLLAAESPVERRVYRVALWDLPASFVLVTLLLGAEWFARRRAELV